MPLDQGQDDVTSRPTGAAVPTVVATRLGALARQLWAVRDTEQLLDELVAAAVELVPGTDAASLSVLRSRGVVEPHRPSDDLAARVDRLETELGEGPRLAAVRGQETVRVSDLQLDGRWPRFSRRAVAAGVRSMLAVRLFVDSDVLGALTLVSRTPNAFDDESETTGRLFASHAAVAFASTRELDGLRSALLGRDVIGQAKGILMERFQIDQDHAFALLEHLSQTTHRKLRDIAGELADTRRLPGS